MNKQSSIKLIETLSNANGVSGFEDDVVKAAYPHCGRNSELREDNIRNLYMYRKKNAAGLPIVMLDGHSDELGFMVQFITPNGLLRFVPVGTWVAANVPAHKVRIRNSEGTYISGVITSKPVHFMTQAEKNEAPVFEKLLIDIGARSRDEAINDFKVEIGAPIVPDVSFEMINGDIMLGKAFDCRLGCCAVIETINELANENLNVNLVGIMSSQEENGGRGARVAIDLVKPQLAIVFEGTPADDSFAPEHEIQGGLRRGPQVRHMDQSMVTSPRFLKFARNIAKDLGIAFQDAVRTGGGTNGGVYHKHNGGVPSIVIGIPVRYAHSHHCFASLDDYMNAVKWAAEIVKSLDENVIGGF